MKQVSERVRERVKNKKKSLKIPKERYNVSTYSKHTHIARIFQNQVEILSREILN